MEKVIRLIVEKQLKIMKKTSDDSHLTMGDLKKIEALADILLKLKDFDKAPDKEMEKIKTVTDKELIELAYKLQIGSDKTGIVE